MQAKRNRGAGCFANGRICRFEQASGSSDMKDLFSEIAATSWRDWLEAATQFVGVAVIIVCIMVIAVGFAPN
jgi:hypothetical protein